MFKEFSNSISNYDIEDVSKKSLRLNACKSIEDVLKTMVPNGTEDVLKGFLYSLLKYKIRRRFQDVRKTTHAV